MPTVSVRLSPHPAHVRTVRLLAVTLARMAGAADPVVDEIRLAVGEAVARAVRLHQRSAPSAEVAVSLCDDHGFQVVVSDDGDPREAVAADMRELADDAVDGGVDLAMSLGVIQGLVEDTEVRAGPAGRGTTVTMSWAIPSP
jgi:anti-sigma regulatory factor (Ser/Thr protein kinase)